MSEDEFVRLDAVVIDNGEVETYYEARGEPDGDTDRSQSVEDALWWLGGEEGSVYLVTKRLVAKKVKYVEV